MDTIKDFVDRLSAKEITFDFDQAKNRVYIQKRKRSMHITEQDGWFEVILNGTIVRASGIVDNGEYHCHLSLEDALEYALGFVKMRETGRARF